MAYVYVALGLFQLLLREKEHVPSKPASGPEAARMIDVAASSRTFELKRVKLDPSASGDESGSL